MHSYFVQVCNLFVIHRVRTVSLTVARGTACALLDWFYLKMKRLTAEYKGPIFDVKKIAFSSSFPLELAIPTLNQKCKVMQLTMQQLTPVREAKFTH